MTTDYVRAGIYVRKDPSWQEHAWTSVPNRLVRDKAISWESRGAFAWLASHDQAFALRSEDLAAAGPKGRNHARDMLRELERHGWLTREKVRNPRTGRYDVHLYNLHPEPVPMERRTLVEASAPAAKKSQVTPATGTPGAGADQQEPGTVIAPEPVGLPTAEDPQVVPATGTPGAGEPGAGGPGPGVPGAYKKNNQKIPPNPPRRGGDAGDLPEETPAATAAETPTEPGSAEAPCSAHGRVRCRPCGLSPRVRAQRERALTAARLLESEQTGDACGMCRADGQRSDGLGTRWQRVHPDGTPVTPWASCDHETPLGVVLAEVAERDAALEAARAQAEPAGPRRPGEAARRAALAAAVPRRLRVDAAVSQPGAGMSGGGSERR